jgi:hypothetical protein
MVKFYGLVFLGQPRDPNPAAQPSTPHDADLWQRGGLAWLAATCVALGLVPATVIGLLDPVTRALTGHGMASLAHSWLYLAPIDPQRASYSPLLFLFGAALLVAIAWLAVRMFYHGRARRAPPWACGFPYLNARMQDSPEGFGQPVRVVFQPAFRIETQAPSPLDAHPRYRETVEDRLWYWLYVPVARAVERASILVSLLQRGRISVYLMYSFATLLVLLLFVR